MLARLAKQHAGDDSTRVVQEMGVWNGAVRVDIAVINGELSGFELKSDSDNLLRLPQQADIYSRVFDRMTLVVGQKHAAKAVELIPAWWGVVVATQGKRSLTLKSIKRSRKNPAQDAMLVARLLWREEALAILEKYNLATGVRSKSAETLYERLVLALSKNQLNTEVRFCLKARKRFGSQGS